MAEQGSNLGKEDANLAEQDVKMAEIEGDDNDGEGEGEINDVATAIAAAKSNSPVYDDSQDVETKGGEVCLRSGHTSEVKSEASILYDTYAAETCCDRNSSPKLQNADESGIPSIDVGRYKSSKLYKHIAGPLSNGSDAVEEKQGHVEQSILVSTSETHVSAPHAVSDQLGNMETADVEESKLLSEEADHHSQSRQDMNHKDSRSWFPRVRPRSLSSGAECEDGSKRPAIICEYFVKGWCIKGSSCRFLHKRDHENATQVEGGVLLTKSELSPDKGSGDNIGKGIQEECGVGSRQYEDTDTNALLERKVSSSLFSIDFKNFPSCKDGSRPISTSREVEVDNHGLSVAESSSIPWQNFCSRFGSSMRELGVSSGLDSISRLVEESAAMRRRYSLDAQSSVPPYHFSSWKNTSLLRNSPLYSGSNSAKYSDSSYTLDRLLSFKYKKAFTPYNWEPSVPFQSSYFKPPVNKSSDVPYDPFRDSIEKSDIGRESVRLSSCGQTQDAKSISGQNSLELPRRLEIESWDKNYSGHDKVIPAVEAESAATSNSDAQNKSLTEEENPMVPGSVKAILKASRSVNDGNSKIQSGELKLENGRQPIELDDEESKIIRCFRAALIEFVKELMKPIWHEGRLSKDVYKVIVQKAEDKILSNLKPNQVPNSSELIKQYLSFSRPKILKLIQAYVDKYGRF
uniref:C3H1-type domain-containing protein n=2 Tax=Chenopodium quinoa TaxID=63459 RepID=A0A803LQ18_CHEQI